jgi:hypothetical protein
MSDEGPTIITAEANFLEELIEQLYVGRREFTVITRREIHNRLQTIRSESRKMMRDINDRPRRGIMGMVDKGRV